MKKTLAIILTLVLTLSMVTAYAAPVSPDDDHHSGGSGRPVIDLTDPNAPKPGSATPAPTAVPTAVPTATPIPGTTPHPEATAVPTATPAPTPTLEPGTTPDPRPTVGPDTTDWGEKNVDSTFTGDYKGTVDGDKVTTEHKGVVDAEVTGFSNEAEVELVIVVDGVEVRRVKLSTEDYKNYIAQVDDTNTLSPDSQISYYIEVKDADGEVYRKMIQTWDIAMQLDRGEIQPGKPFDVNYSKDADGNIVETVTSPQTGDDVPYALIISVLAVLFLAAMYVVVNRMRKA